MKTAAAKGRKITSNVRVAMDEKMEGDALNKEEL
jgi:hypothetical protein